MLNNLLDITPDFENKDAIILRDYLALERTKLANERTLLSYIRASLYLFIGGLAVLQVNGFHHIKWLGYLSLAISVVIIIIGIYRFYVLKSRLKKYYEEINKENLKKEA